MAQIKDSGGYKAPAPKAAPKTAFEEERGWDRPVTAPAWLDAPSRGPYAKGGRTEPAAPDYNAGYGIGGAPVFNPQQPVRPGGPYTPGPVPQRPPAWLNAQPSQMGRDYGAAGKTGFLGGGQTTRLNHMPQTDVIRVEPRAPERTMPTGSFFSGGGEYVQGPAGPVPRVTPRIVEPPRSFGDQADSPYWPLMGSDGGGGGGGGGGFGTNYGWGGGGGYGGYGYGGYGGGYQAPAWLGDMGLFQWNYRA